MTHRDSTSRRVVVAVAAGLSVAATGCAGPSGQHAPTDNDREFFFGGSLDTYGQTLSETDHDASVISRALRRIDVCGFIDVPAISTALPNITSYGPNPNLMTCTLTLKTDDAQSPKHAIRVGLNTLANQSWDHDPRTKWSDIQVGNITVKKGPECDLFFPLGLNSLAGAPTASGAASAFKRQYVSVSPDSVGATCDQLTAVATAAAKVRERGIPRLSPQSKVWNPVFLDDPCSLFPGLTGFSDFNPVATSGYSCGFTPKDAHDSPTYAEISLDTTRALDTSFATENHDGVTLYIEPDYQPGTYHDCRIEVAVGSPLKPAAGNIASDNNAPADDQKSWPRPVVRIRGNTSCDLNKQVAVAAAKKLG